MHNPPHPGEILRQHLTGVFESAPQLPQLAGAGRAGRHRFLPFPIDPIAIDPAVWGEQHLPKIGRQQRPEMMHSPATDPGAAICRRAAAQLRSRPPAGRGFHSPICSAPSAVSNVASTQR